MKFFSVALMVLALAAQAGLANAQEERTYQCRALDAQGKPIPKALVQVWHKSKEAVYGINFFDAGPKDDAAPGGATVTSTDEQGNFTIPQVDAGDSLIARLMHADYGTAEAICGWGYGAVTRFPLVKKGSDAEPRALRGVVLDPENQPVAGVRVQLSAIRMPGLETEYHPNANAVYTDKAGRFRFYPAQGRDLPELIPLNSAYSVSLVEPKYALFPLAASYKNSEEAVIHLDRPAGAHHFVYTGRDGKPLPLPEPPGEVELSYRRDKAGESVKLPARYALRGGKLAPGWYEAEYRGYAPGKFVMYWPFEVTKDSPEELVIPFPPTVTYTGRTVDAVTGKPLAGVFVAPALIAQDVPPRLTAEDWKALGALPPALDPDSPAAKALLKKYGLWELPVRTDAEGKYALALPPGIRRYGVTAFGEWLMPLRFETNELEAIPRERVALPDLRLFPAAKILPSVNAQLAEEKDCLLDCDWRLEEKGQPEWFTRSPKENDEIEHRLHNTNCISGFDVGRVDKDQPPRYVPAGLRLRLHFYLVGTGENMLRNPGWGRNVWMHDTDIWLPSDSKESFLFAPGETRKIEDLFAPREAK